MDPITYPFSEFDVPALLDRWKTANDPQAEFRTSGPTLEHWQGAGDPPTIDQLSPMLDDLNADRARCVAIRGGLLPIFEGMKAGHQVFFEPVRQGVVAHLMACDAAKARQLIDDCGELLPEALQASRAQMLAVFDAYP